MKTRLLCSLILLTVALLPGATAAHARAERIALAGGEHMFVAGAPDQVWTAGDWVHQRDLPFTGTFDFGVLKGTETQLANAKLNPLTGEGHVWGVVAYTDSATGVVCSGVRQGQLTNFLLTAKIVTVCSDGSLLTGTLQDIQINFPPGSPAPSDVLSQFTGELLRP